MNYVKRLALVILFLFFGNDLLAQNESEKKIDSITRLLPKMENDTAKANAYHRIAYLYEQIDNTKMNLYNNRLLALSKKINYANGLGYYYFHLTSSYYYENNIEKQVFCIKKAKQIFEKCKDVRYYLIAAHREASVYGLTDNYKEIKENINESLSKAEGSKHYKEIADLYIQLGLCYNNENNFSKSIAHFKTAISYLEKSRLSERFKALVYLYMAFTYSDMNKLNEALRFVNLAIKLDNNNNLNTMATMYLEKSRILNKLKQYKNALSLTIQNQEYFAKQQMNSSNIGISNICVKGECYLGLKDYKLAIKEISSVINKVKDTVTKIKALENLSLAYLGSNKINDAKVNIDKAIDLASYLPKKNAVNQIYEVKSLVEEKAGNYSESLLFYKKFAKNNQNINDDFNKDRIEELQVEFNLIEKNYKIKNLELSQSQKNSEIAYKNKYLIFITSFFLLVLIGNFVIFRLYSSIRKRNKIIEEKNEDLKNVNELIRNSLYERGLLLKEIHHRVKNNMQLILSLLRIQARETNDIGVKDFIRTSQSRITSMALIHENLYNSEELNRIEVKDYIEKLIESIQKSYVNIKEITIQMDLDDLHLDIQTIIPIGLIINELINNSYKHAFVDNEKGKISLSFKIYNNNYELIVKDNGVGISKVVESKSTMGLELVNALVSQINGVINIIKSEGTVYKINFASF